MIPSSFTDTYLSLILSFPHLSPNTLFNSFLLTFCRIVPIMVFAPFFGAKIVPPIVRVMFAFSLTLIFLPLVLMNLHEEIPSNGAFLGFLLKELLYGTVLGFLSSIPFYIAQSSGSLIDHIRGASSLQVTDPTMGSQTGPLGIFYNAALIAGFYLIGGVFFFLEALESSFVLLPINKFINPTFFSTNVPFWHVIMGLTSHVISLSIQLGAPSILATLMTDIFLGISNRLAPQVQIVFLGMPLKAWTGLALLAIAWYFILQQLNKESLLWFREMQQFVVQAEQSSH